MKEFKMPPYLQAGSEYDMQMKVMARTLNHSIMRLRSSVKVVNPYDMVEIDSALKGLNTKYFEIYFEGYDGMSIDPLPFSPLLKWFDDNYDRVMTRIMFKSEEEAALVITDIFRHCVKQYRALQEKNARETEIRDDFIDPNLLPHVSDD